jgi:hypothetical protein
MIATGTCQHCATIRALRDDGRVAPHRVGAPRLPGDARRRARRRRCPGSGQLPRRAGP